MPASFDLDVLPPNLKSIGQKLRDYGYGFRGAPELPGFFMLIYPPASYAQDRGTEYLTEATLGSGLLKALRHEEMSRGRLLALKQYDPAWGNVIYGRGAEYGTVRSSGCAPTALAIVRLYLERTGAVPRRANAAQERADQKRAVIETVQWAGKDQRIRIKGAGTSGDQMVARIEKQWGDLTGRKITDPEEAVQLLQAGHLLIYSARPCVGWKTREALLANPKEPDAREYRNGHFVVLWGADNSPNGTNRVIWVIDPGDAVNPIRYIGMRQLKAGSVYYVYPKAEHK